jgi:hypothetical protein
VPGLGNVLPAVPEGLILFSQHKAAEVTFDHLTMLGGLVIRGAFGFGSQPPFVPITT